jgi:hypothetical protein
MKSVDEHCFECGNSENLHNHHVVPKVLGGTKTIKLCETCHGKVHNRNFLYHKQLQKEGIFKAKQRNVRFGRPEALSEVDKRNFIGDVYFNETSTKELATSYKISEPTARRLRSKILYEKNYL